MKSTYLIFSLLLWLMASGCSINEQSKEPEKQAASDQKVELTVSAAASLQNVLNDIKAAFEKKHPDVTITYNFGASGSLQQQISQGAPVDLFFSAAEDKFDALVKEGLIEKGTDLVGNEIVLVVPNDTGPKIKEFNDLVHAENISIGVPESVPAGKYAQEVLENLHIWKAVEKKIVYAKDVRQVLTYVETGNVDAGIVYKTDTLISSNIQLAATAQKSLHAPVIYPAGIVKNTPHLKEARMFYQFLQQQTSMEIFKKHGFKEIK